MKNVTRWFVVGALAATGALAFACGGGNTEGGGGTTPSATATTSASATTSATAMTTATATATATTPAVPAGPPLVVVAMKMNDPKAKHAIEIKDDGSVMGDGKPIAKFVGATLQDTSGKSLVTVAADGTLTMGGVTSTKSAKFNEKDELVISDGAKMAIGDDGVVKLFNADGKADKDSGKVKLTGFKPAGRRAAVVFVVAMMMSAPEPTVSTATATTATPATTAKK